MLRNNFFVMSIDVDSWSSLLRFYSVEHTSAEANNQVNIDYGMSKLFDLFSHYDLKATFFVPGEVAEFNNESVKQIVRNGHELACHGCTHEKNECLTEFAKQLTGIEQATNALQKVAGQRPRGFRAPCLRANGETARALERLDYVYDSSVIPSAIPGYYGQLSASSKPYHPSTSTLERKGSSRIIELPVSVNPILRIPLSAAWMRNLGFSWVKAGVKLNFYMGNPVVFYIHPRDVSPLPKVKGLPWHLYQKAGKRTYDMLDKLTRFVKRDGNFITALELAQKYKVRMED